MIIQVTPNRRLVSYAYGWKIERKHFNKKKKKAVWKLDVAPYPATLSHGLRMIFESELMDKPDEFTLEELRQEIENTLKVIKGVPGRLQDKLN